MNAVFSKYNVNPPRNINFGPVQFNEKKVRTFELKNEGIFEWTFNVFELLEGKLQNERSQEDEIKRQGTKDSARKKEEEKKKLPAG